MKKYYYFKELTKDRENRLARLDFVNGAQFEEMTNQARATFNAQNVTPKHGRKNFDIECAFISSGDSLTGFYFPSADLRNPNTNYKLLLIAFETVRGYDFEKHEAKPETLRPVAIYEDGSENLYTIHEATPDRRPLDDWKKELATKAENAKARAEMWRNVKRLYKKNGDPFAILSKNFDGVTISENATIYGKPNGFKLETSGRATDEKYISDALYNCDRFPLNSIDDIIPTINKYADYLTEYAAQTEKTLALADSIYNDVFGALFEKILKYQTPSNADGVKLEYFTFTLREMLNKFYVSL